MTSTFAKLRTSTLNVIDQGIIEDNRMKKIVIYFMSEKLQSHSKQKLRILIQMSDSFQYNVY